MDVQLCLDTALSNPIAMCNIFQLNRFSAQRFDNDGIRVCVWNACLLPMFYSLSVSIIHLFAICLLQINLNFIWQLFNCRPATFQEFHICFCYFRNVFASVAEHLMHFLNISVTGRWYNFACKYISQILHSRKDRHTNIVGVSTIFPRTMKVSSLENCLILFGGKFSTRNISIKITEIANSSTFN